jgi:hypothetical protein
MNPFTQYSDILFEGFFHNPRSNDIVSRKHDLLENILDYYNLDNKSILFVGFSPWCLSLENESFAITEVSDRVISFLDKENFNYEHYNFGELIESGKQFEIVVAADEYFTFADSDQNQRNLVDQLSKLTQKIIITTLRDYKNQDFKNREFSQPILIRGNNTDKIFLEHYDYDIKDKNSSVSRTFVIEDNKSSVYGPFSRRNMYFKQLAKFSIDAGASSFYVHKNLMYKSVIKKNYEHIITIKF